MYVWLCADTCVGAFICNVHEAPSGVAVPKCFLNIKLDAYNADIQDHGSTSPDV